MLIILFFSFFLIHFSLFHMVDAGYTSAF